MKFLHVQLLSYLFTLSTITHALHISIHGQRKPFFQPRIVRRADVTGSLLNNSADISYSTNVTLGGQIFQLLVDTGSSDLWVAGNIPNTTSTNFTATVNYAVGSVQGPVKTARLDFDGQTVPDQAFLQIAPSPSNQDGSGILGLGPNSGSNIYAAVGAVAGASVVDRIFLQNATTPNFITVLLGRSDDPTDLFPGSITVGGVLSGYENVLNEPKLPVTTVVQQESVDQHFQVLLDEDGLVGPDGQPILLHTNVTSTSNRNQATAVIDTGFSLPQLPDYAVNAIYNRFQGAELKTIDSIGQLWIVPCNLEVNITFKFGGRQYPIHPLDATINPTSIGISNITNSNGQNSCIGAFQPVSFNTGTVSTYDMVLGMAFLRNVYVVMNYGDFIVGSTAQAAPYMQFLSTTDPAEAHRDFVNVRLNGVDTTMNQTLINYNGTSGLSGRSIGIIVATVLVVAILVAIIGFVIYRRRTNLRRINNISSPLATYPSPSKAEYSFVTAAPYPTPLVSHRLHQQQVYPSYTPIGNQPSQYHPHPHRHRSR